MASSEFQRQQILARMRVPAWPPGGILSGVDESDLALASERITEAARHLERPFSLCQLEWSDSDRTWLHDWPQKVTSEALAAALADDRLCESVGLTLLAVLMELGQEVAISGEIWPILSPRFAPAAAQLIYAARHPRQRVRFAVEAACRRLGIRHSFGREGVQAYSLTVYQQFGFSAPSLSRLVQWVEQPATRPTSLNVLLRERHPFGKLWEGLTRWVRGKAHKPELEALRSSPFLPRQWHAALERGRKDLHSQARNYFRFDWPSDGPPTVHLDLAALFSDCEDTAYFVSAGAESDVVTKHLGRFEPESLSWTLEEPRLTVCLDPLDASAAPACETLVLWDVDADFVLIDPHQGLERRKLPRAGFWLFCRNGYEASGAVRWAHIHPEWTVYEFEALPPGDFLVGPQGPVELHAPPSQNPLARAELEVLGKHVARLPMTVEAMVRGLGRHLPGCQFAWRGHELTPVTTALGFPELDLHLPVELERAEAALQVRCLHQERSYVTTVRRSLTLQEVTWLSPRGWEPFRDVPEVEVSDLARRPVRVFFPGEEFALVEGNVLYGRATGGEQYLCQLGGYGLPLVLRHGPFVHRGEDRRLADSVVFRGQVRSLELRGKSFQLNLRRAYHGDADNYLAWWDGGDGVVFQSLDECRIDRATLEGPVPKSMEGKRVVVALGDQTARLGAAWVEMPTPPASADWKLVAGMLRWLHLPVLAPAWWKAWGPALQAQRQTVLVEWMHSGFRCQGRRLEAPEWVEFGEVIRRVAQPSGTISKSRAEQLLRAVPLLSWLRTAPLFLKTLLTAAQSDRKGLAMRYFGVRAGRDLEPLCAAAGTVLQADARFAKSLGDDFLRGRESAKLEMALTLSPFQDYALARWLLD